MLVFKLIAVDYICLLVYCVLSSFYLVTVTGDLCGLVVTLLATAHDIPGSTPVEAGYSAHSRQRNKYRIFTGFFWLQNTGYLQDFNAQFLVEEFKFQQISHEIMQ